MADCKYVSVEDIRGYLVNCEPVPICEVPDDYLCRLILAKQEEIECITGQRFCQCEETYLFDGCDSCVLSFTPLVSIPLAECLSLEVFDPSCCVWKKAIPTCVSPHSIEICGCCTYEDKVYQCPMCDEECSCKCNQSAKRCNCSCNCGVCLWKCSCFPAGCKNVRVSGIWGSEIPLALQNLLIEMVLECLIPGVTTGGAACGIPGAAGTRIKSVEWEDDLKIEFFDAGSLNPESPFSTGNSKWDRTLARYRNYSGMFNAVNGCHSETCANDPLTKIHRAIRKDGYGKGN